MNSVPDQLGQMSAPDRPQHRTDALAPICDINGQCLQMLVEVARGNPSSADPFLSEILILASTLNSQTLATAARFPFLLLDFGFSEPDWWRDITGDSNESATELTWLTPFPRATASRLSRSIIMLAWHTVRTDTEAAVVLLGITPEVAGILRSMPIHSIDDLAERHARRLRLRWADRPGVWRQLIACAKHTEIEAAHEFVLHALQLTAGAALPPFGNPPAAKAIPSKSQRHQPY